MEPDELVEFDHTSLEKILYITGKPILNEVQIQKRAIPQYTIGYRDKMRSLEEVEKNYPGIYITGAYRGGVSVEDCIANGKATAVKISGQLSELNKASLTEVTYV